MGLSHVLDHKAASKATGSVDDDVKFSAHNHSIIEVFFDLGGARQPRPVVYADHCKVKTSDYGLLVLSYPTMFLDHFV